MVELRQHDLNRAIVLLHRALLTDAETVSVPLLERLAPNFRSVWSPAGSHGPNSSDSVEFRRSSVQDRSRKEAVPWHCWLGDGAVTVATLEYSLHHSSGSLQIAPFDWSECLEGLGISFWKFGIVLFVPRSRLLGEGAAAWEADESCVYPN